MPTIPLILPTEATAAGTFARQLARLTGPAVDHGDSTVAAAEELALGQALADGRTATTNAVDNALPPTTTDLLAEWERALGIVVSPGLAIATRRATILAHIRAAGGSPQRILASVETLAGGTCALAEWLATDVTPDPRQVFRFGVGVPSPFDLTFRGALDDLLQRMSPAHTTWDVTTIAALDGIVFDDDDTGFDEGLFSA